MKKNKIIVILIAIIIPLLFATKSYAGESHTYFDLGTLTGENVQSDTLQTAGNNIVLVITTIGIITSVVVLMILGIKYMMGSIEEKANYKKTLIPYVIGALCVFGASTLAQAIYEIAISL